MWMGHGLSLSHWVRGGDIIWVVWDCGVGQAFEFRFFAATKIKASGQFFIVCRPIGTMVQNSLNPKP